MKKQSIIILIFVMLLTCSVSGVLAQDNEIIKNKFKASFPQIKLNSINKSEMEGIYEVVVPGKILYYLPQKDYIFVGDIWNMQGKNVTAERESEIISAKVKQAPLEKALKIGNGKNIVIEFTDPDCPYCRKAANFLAEQKDMTRYIFFFPLSSHQDADKKIKYIFCAADKPKAYEEAMNGKLDTANYAVCKDKKAEKLLDDHKQIVEKIGLNSTPHFWINGRHVSGADIPLMGQLLKAENVQKKN